MVTAFAIFAGLAAAEVGLALLLRRATSFDHVLSAARRYYRSYDLHMVQYLPETARYDPRLSYRLRSGRSVFANREFETILSINSLGVRDDEESLVRPEIVVLGDSFAMGWGVDEGRSFPDLVEKWTGRRVLNASVPSYGTAREMLLLDETDRSGLRTLVVQYSDNDDVENRTFVDSGFRLPVMERAEYERIRDEHARLRYYPGEYLHRFLPLLLTADEVPTPTPTRSVPAREAARVFLDVLSHALPRIGNAHVVVLEIDGFGIGDSSFVDAVRAGAHEHPELPTITTVDLSARLSAKHFLPIDGHLNAAGHEEVAKILVELLAAIG